MQPTVAVELSNNTPSHVIKFPSYTGDNDSTTEAHVHGKVTNGVEKFSYMVHVKRSLQTGLYNLSESGQL